MSRAILLALALLVPLPSLATTACRLVSGGSIAFGTYDILAAAPTDSLVNVIVTCDRDAGPQHVTLTLRVDQGVNGTSVNARRMLHTGGTGDALSYGLYRDVARSSVWGNSDGVDTISSVLSVPNRGSASAQFSIYGRIPAGQDVYAGSYSDTVQVTVIY